MSDVDGGGPSAGPPPLPPPSSSGFRLSDREELVAAELERIDPQLAGLFRIGLDLCARGDLPGLSYVIAEAGRELDVGVINFLADGAPELTTAELEAIPDKEGHRGPIARALRLHPQHPLVTAWLGMHQRLNGEAHFVPNRVTSSTAASDFRELASLLMGRIAPYFDAQDEADAVLAVEHPGPEHLEAVKQILVRPALRRYFLQKLTNPEWLPLLERLKSFDDPPNRIVNADGSWSMAAWLEGEYLTRIAGAEPDAVTARLEAIPLTNDNPVVWDIAARAGAALPPALAARVLARIAIGIRALPKVVLPEAMLTLAEHASAVDPKSALLLLNALLWMRRREDLPSSDDEAELRRYQYSTSWLLERIDLHDAEETLDRLVPSIARTDPHGVLELLGEKLRAAMRGVDPKYSEERARDTRWCGDLDDTDHESDLRSLLARALARVASTVAAMRAEDAARVVTFLKTLPPGIGQRLLYFVVARSAPHLVGEVDSLLSRPDLFEWEMPGREVGDVLRKRFSDAGPDAQSEFLQTLERGPDEEGLKHLIEWAEHVGRDSSPEAALAYWQRRQLRRFGANLPGILAPIAARLGYEPQPADPEELDLIEIGWSSGSAGWVADQSPFSVATLLEGGPEQAARAIREWVPEGGIDRPTLRGLDEALEHLGNNEPDRAIAIARELLRSGAARGVSGILRGLSLRHRRGAELPIVDLADLLHSALEIREPDPDWAALRSTGIDVASDVMADVAPERAAEFGRLTADILEDEGTWPADEGDDPTTVHGVISAGLNVLSGRATALLIRLALADYHHRRKGMPDGSPEAEAARRDVADALLPTVQSILSRSGHSAIAARATLGTYLPQLAWFAPEWWASQAENLLDDAIDHPTKNPLWAAYLTRAPLYDSTFTRLRPWYALAVARPILVADDTKSRTWEPEPHLVEHVLQAVLRGLARPSDQDRLVENTFAHVPVEDLSHGFWSIFRGWTDAAMKGESAAPEFVARLVQLWEWRLAELQNSPDSVRRAEEANGLLWLCRTPFIPVADVIALGSKTLDLVREASGTLHTLWERLPELAEAEPDGTFAMTERAVAIELDSQWPHFPVEELGSVFRIFFSQGSDATKSAAIRLLNRLGDAGHAEFGQFRPEA